MYLSNEEKNIVTRKMNQTKDFSLSTNLLFQLLPIPDYWKKVKIINMKKILIKEDETGTKWQINWAYLLQKWGDILETWLVADYGQIPRFCGAESEHPTMDQKA